MRKMGKGMTVSRPRATPVVMAPDTFVLPGTTIGQGQGEPEWSPEDIEMIRERMMTRLPVVGVKDTRRARPDAQGKYILVREDGTV